MNDPNDPNALDTLDTLLAGPPFLGYAYSYPHKSAYRPLSPPVALETLWRDTPEATETALYFHIPFCEMRCGFCNLFTTPNPPEETEPRYLDALERQARVVPQRPISRVAFGGGTPTFLSLAGLERVLSLAASFAPLAELPFSVETSPRTATPEKLALLRDFGVDRVSIGIQSFVEAEVQASGRAQRPEWVAAALGNIRKIGFPTLNIDLIYGLPGQTEASWQRSLTEALLWQPEELYLYPLYVRPLTGLAGKAKTPVEALTLYRQARERLLHAGYEQVSLRFFRRMGAASHPSSDAVGGNLIGLGCGARSYTQSLHYSSEFAVGRAGVRNILAGYLGRTEADFALADYGVWLSDEEQVRRRVVYGLLQQTEGVNASVLEKLPQLTELIERNLAVCENGTLRLTPSGWERADVLGPWLTSAAMRAQMETFSLR
ncbi:STM4012 family radical SAM protein [Armatimonas sp.]|uniref:STM4012 family radical SAM protein n=1 Tax=Armatimonas sp. TaxID=1872638 RepID=UPI00374DADCB